MPILDVAPLGGGVSLFGGSVFFWCLLPFLAGIIAVIIAVVIKISKFRKGDRK